MVETINKRGFVFWRTKQWEPKPSITLFHRGDLVVSTWRAHSVGYMRSLFSFPNFEDFVPFMSHCPLFHLFPHYSSQPQHLFFPMCDSEKRQGGRVKNMNFASDRPGFASSSFGVRISFVKLYILMWRHWNKLHLSKFLQKEMVSGKRPNTVADTKWILNNYYALLFYFHMSCWIPLPIWI